MQETLLEVKNVTMVFPDGTEALKGINFTIKKGELVSIIGPSGAGKSTLMRSLNLLNKPTEGSISFEGEDVIAAKGRQLRHIRRRIGMVFQHFNLVKRSPAYLNVLHGRLGYVSTIKGGLGRFSEADTRGALEILRRVGLEDQAFKRADELSGGQQQRVGIARAIAQSPSLLLADEPIASLDPSSSENVMVYLKSVCQEDGLTSIVNLHQVDFAKQFADRIIGVKAGEIVFDGTPRELTDGITDYLYYSA
ncbi:phosphonate ABC transporter ATP-binding protein [Salipaludibacillus agaradhaerens]|uniref:Phosphonate ABC transporter ATP-binding protein n=1 Tax=Salipaludibacillus agaradhaerens TaxID=76935 RepID=A0A9Q4B3Q7_SALAG|nr:phosphonate ABC transporter ATP-binding protein [Salipaludibacillus agaradhaerens]MCR6097853.1 phosphonate ABC transporter ATP-binding protein [Salipaludibacillus agaradhaerens]MCR6116518.1 phosphonate ABC transporter ATP-binding protein [Salipaludibacillus agaradhaerens]